jgi:sulfopyruvate decarboxylase TPP-binding subunit
MTIDLPLNIQSCVESICELGCERVNEIIALIEAGKAVDEVSALDREEQNHVLRELKAIMAVYDQEQAKRL